jgi:hypothetical protein
MNDSKDIDQQENLFIDVQQVKWNEISVKQQSDLDFIPDMLTDTELRCLEVLLSSGAISAREVWNRVSERIYKLENGLEDVEADYDELQDILQDEDIDHPSYYSVKKGLTALVENGLSGTRPPNKGNTDKLYTVNPQFKKVWRNRRTKMTQDDQWSSMSRRCIEFYRIDKEERGRKHGVQLLAQIKLVSNKLLSLFINVFRCELGL